MEGVWEKETVAEEGLEEHTEQHELPLPRSPQILPFFHDGHQPPNNSLQGRTYSYRTQQERACLGSVPRLVV